MKARSGPKTPDRNLPSESSIGTSVSVNLLALSAFPVITTTEIVAVSTRAMVAAKAPTMIRATQVAQAEADEQQVNLTQFSLFFPEKREFFLENAGIFYIGDIPRNKRATSRFSPPEIQDRTSPATLSYRRGSSL